MIAISVKSLRLGMPIRMLTGIELAPPGRAVLPVTLHSMPTDAVAAKPWIWCFAADKRAMADRYVLRTIVLGSQDTIVARRIEQRTVTAAR